MKNNKQSKINIFSVNTYEHDFKTNLSKRKRKKNMFEQCSKMFKVKKAEVEKNFSVFKQLFDFNRNQFPLLTRKLEQTTNLALKMKKKKKGKWESLFGWESEKKLEGINLSTKDNSKR